MCVAGGVSARVWDSDSASSFSEEGEEALS
jgi:hypothetical protein